MLCPLVPVVVLAFCTLGRAAEPPRHALPPLVNRLDRDWPRTLLHYDVDLPAGAFRDDRIAVVDASGATVPGQFVVVTRHPDGSVSRGRVSFYMELRRGQRHALTLAPAANPPPPALSVTASAPDGGAIDVTSASDAGVRIPAPTDRTFEPPAEPASVPAPILSYRLPDGRWAGKGWIDSTRKITHFSQRTVADGPLYKEYAYELRFHPAGHYRARVRVEAELQAVRVFEDFDSGSTTDAGEAFVLSFSDGWTPDHALFTCWAKPAGATELASRGARRDDMALYNQILTPVQQDTELTRLYPWRDYGTRANTFGLYATAAPEPSPYVGLISQHVGAWRLPESGAPAMVRTPKGVVARFGLSLRPKPTPHDQFSTAQTDPNLPPTTGRRLWLLALGERPRPDAKGNLDTSRLDHLRNHDGFVTLDDYKDWTLDWPEQPGLPRPRVFTTPDQLARTKANLDRHPGRDALKDHYLITADEAAARRDAERLLKSLDSRFNEAIASYNPGFRQIQPDEGLIYLADSCLASKQLPPETRRAIRAKAAAIWHLTSHPNYYPRGAGVHLGNPNMTFNRSMAIPMWATLLQDHPRAKDVLDDMATLVPWLVAYNTTPAAGVFRDSPHYATYGPAPFIAKAAIALRNAGYDADRWPAIRELGQYFLDLESSPAPLRSTTVAASHRDLPARHLPSFGNGRDVHASLTHLHLAQLHSRSDPAFAAQLMSAFADAASYLGTGDNLNPAYNWLYFDPSIAPAKPDRGDRFIAGFGGVLRAHVDTPHEAYLALRSGYVQSHWATNQGSDHGSFVLYARGRQLCPGTGWMYSNVPDGFSQHSRLAFGRPTANAPFGRADNNVEDYGFTPSAGYLLSRQPFDEFEWFRQALLLRSRESSGPTYAVLRDTTRGKAPPAWWHQWVVVKDDAVKRTPAGVRAAIAPDVALDIAFIDPPDPQVTVKGTKVQGFTEDYTQLTLPRAAGQPTTALFFTHKPGDAAPRVERLADGVTRVATAGSTDYLFLSAADQPVTFKNDDLDVTLHAGVVRVEKDRVLLINASGRHGSLSYKGLTARGIGPFERPAPLNPPRVETTDAGRELPPVAIPAAAGDRVNFGGDLKGHAIAGEKSLLLVATEGSGTIAVNDVHVRGEAPFVLHRRPGHVRITTDGRPRVLQFTIPGDFPPQLGVDVRVDGASRQCAWQAGVVAVGVPAGRHTLTLRPYANPPAWKDNAYTRLLPVPSR